MSNTKINYLYRDASNYKAYPERDVIVSGELTREDFGDSLHMEEMFIPHDLGLPELQSRLEEYPNPEDRIWHQLLELEPTEAEPTIEITAAQIKSRLQKIKEEGWYESAAFKRQQFLKNILG